MTSSCPHILEGGVRASDVQVAVVELVDELEAGRGTGFVEIGASELCKTCNGRAAYFEGFGGGGIPLMVKNVSGV